MNFFRDLRSSQAIYAKGLMFVVVAVLSATLLIARLPRWDIALLLSICVWASCRAYYFAFYVIEKYVDSQFRFSGLLDFCKYLLRHDKPE